MIKIGSVSVCTYGCTDLSENSWSILLQLFYTKFWIKDYFCQAALLLAFLSVTKSEQKKEHLQKMSSQAKKIQHLHERQFCTEVRYVVAFATYCLFKER